MKIPLSAIITLLKGMCRVMLFTKDSILDSTKSFVTIINNYNRKVFKIKIENELRKSARSPDEF